MEHNIASNSTDLLYEKIAHFFYTVISSDQLTLVEAPQKNTMYVNKGVETREHLINR